MEFRTLRNCGDKTLLDCHQEFRETFKEVPPFTVDPDNGKILNKTTSIVLVKSEPIDIQAEIDSYFESSDLKTNIERLERQGMDPRTLNKPDTGVSGVDLSLLPDNVNDWHAFFEERTEALAKEKLAKAKEEADRKAAVALEQSNNEAFINSQIEKYLATHNMEVKK